MARQLDKPLVRVTQIEAFRRWARQGEGDPFEITEQSVIDSVTREFGGNEYTLIGTAFHAIVETGRPKAEPVPDGVREYTLSGKAVKEPVPSGRRIMVEGHAVTLDVAQCRAALDYRQEHPWAFHEIRERVDFGEAVVTGCADMLDGTEIRDIKTKFSQPRDTDYINSCQWRYYMQLFNVDVFHFDLFVFQGYDRERHGLDVRGLPLRRREPVTVYRYPRLEEDNARLLREFMEWIDSRGLREYLMDTNI